MYFFRVATAPTVYGIETIKISVGYAFFVALQQHLPFTVLKLAFLRSSHVMFNVATAPTVYGIETHR